MKRVTYVLRGVEVEFGDSTQDLIWLRWGDDDMHYLLPPSATVTIDGEQRERTYVLYWLMVHRGRCLAVDVDFSRGGDGMKQIEAIGVRPV